MSSNDASEWKEGWPYVAVGLLGTTVAGAGFVTIGTALKAIIADTGWQRTDIVAVTLIMGVVSFIVSPTYGVLLDRFGARKVALTGAALSPLGLASAGLSTGSVVTWWLAWVAVVATASLIQVTTWSYAIARRFTKHRGFAMGLTISGMGVANIIVPPLGVFLIHRLGWRGMYFGLGGLGLVTLLPLTFFFFHDLPAASVGAGERAAPLVGYTAKEAFRTTKYWRLGLAVFIIAGAAAFVAVHLQPILLETGVTAMAAASIAVFYGPAQIAARLVGGYLLDRLSGPVVVIPLFLAPLGSLFLLSHGITSGSLVVLIPILTGAAAGVEMDVAAYFVSRHFGTRAYGTLFGSMYVLHAGGYAVSPAVGAYVRDHYGTYQPMFYGLMLLVPVGALLSGSLGRYPKLLPGAAAKIASSEIKLNTNVEIDGASRAP